MTAQIEHEPIAHVGRGEPLERGRDLIRFHELPGKRNGMTARDLAHVMTLATKGLKASTATVAELRRMTDGLIATAIATTRWLLRGQSNGTAEKPGSRWWRRRESNPRPDHSCIVDLAEKHANLCLGLDLALR